MWDSVSGKLPSLDVLLFLFSLHFLCHTHAPLSFHLSLSLSLSLSTFLAQSNCWPYGPWLGKSLFEELGGLILVCTLIKSSRPSRASLWSKGLKMLYSFRALEFCKLTSFLCYLEYRSKSLWSKGLLKMLYSLELWDSAGWSAFCVA